MGNMPLQILLPLENKNKLNVVIINKQLIVFD